MAQALHVDIVIPLPIATKATAVSCTMNQQRGGWGARVEGLAFRGSQRMRQMPGTPVLCPARRPMFDYVPDTSLSPSLSSSLICRHCSPHQKCFTGSRRACHILSSRRALQQAIASRFSPLPIRESPVKGW